MLFMKSGIRGYLRAQGPEFRVKGGGRSGLDPGSSENLQCCLGHSPLQ